MTGKIFQKNVLAVSGIAGHGKDTFISTVIDNYTGSNFFPIRMATELKKLSSHLLSQSKVDELGISNKYDAMEYLKNNDQNYIVIGGFNAREIQQKMGTEVLRSFDESIHIVFECAKIAAIKEENPVFYSADIRFRNELEFMLNLKDDPIDFAKYMVHKNEYNFNSEDIINRMVEIYGNDLLKIDDFDKLKSDVDGILELISSADKPFNTHKFKDLDSFDLKNKTLDESFDLGYINVFRPILSDEFVKSQNGKNPPAALLRQEIREFTKMSSDQVYDIQQYYKISKIDFNIENINNFGFLRADISHISERDLDDYKPESYKSLPHHLVDPVSEILKLTTDRGIERTLMKKEDRFNGVKRNQM